MTTMIDKILYAFGSLVGHFVRQFNVYFSLAVIVVAIYYHINEAEIIDFLFLITVLLSLIFIKVDSLSTWTSE